MDANDPRTEIEEILHLPPLPGTAQQLLSALADEDIDTHKLASLIELDPPLAARIVGVANSAFFNPVDEVHSVAEAIARVLGLDLVRSLALGIALSAPFDTAACASFDLERFWYRAVVTANLTNGIARLIGLPGDEAETCFLCGLLHNLGQLVLVHAFPARMDELFRRARQDPELQLTALEADHLSLDELEAGGIVARRWKLPSRVVACIAHRHEPASVPGQADFLRLLAYCIELADRLQADAEAAPPALATGGPLLADLEPERLEEMLIGIRQQDGATRALAAAMSHG